MSNKKCWSNCSEDRANQLLVASNGSVKPVLNPTAKQLLTHTFSCLPASNLNDGRNGLRSCLKYLIGIVNVARSPSFL